MNIEYIINKLNEKYCEKCVKKEQEHLINAINLNVNIDKQINFIDIGCGLGGDLDFVKKHFQFNISAIDINPNLVQINIKKGYDAKIGKVTDLSIFKNDSFDIVYCSHVIEHLGYPDITKAIKELYRITKIKEIIKFSLNKLCQTLATL